MDVVTPTPPVQGWPDVFRQLVVTNSRHWLECVQTDPDHLTQELPQVLRALTYSLSLPEAWEATRELILHLSPLMLRRGQAVEWQKYLLQGIARSAERKDPVEIEFRLQLGNLYRLQGRLTEAGDTLQTGLELCDIYHTKQHYWALLSRLAMVARLSGRHDEALAYCREVLSASKPSTAEQAEAFNVKGLVAYDRGEWDEALTAIEQALKWYNALDNNFETARMLTNKGVMLQHRGRIFQNTQWIDQAAECNEEAIRRFRLAGDKNELFKPIMNLGNVYLLRHDYQAAVYQYRKAMSHFQEHNYVIDLAFTYNNLGLAYVGLEKWQAAEDYFSASIKIWQTLKVNHELVNVLDNLGSMFIKTKQIEKARNILDQALDLVHELQDSAETLRLQEVIRNRLSEIGST